MFRFAALWALLSGIALLLAGCGGGGEPTGPTTTTLTTTTIAVPGEPTFDLLTDGIRAVSYGPMFLQDPSCIDTFTSYCATGFVGDDFAADWANTMWAGGTGGRGDLANLKGMGANTVRLYGNDPRYNKRQFLDVAFENELQVIDGLSSYPYNQGGAMCATSVMGADCHDTISFAYGQNLDRGFLVGGSKASGGGRYHPALAIINVMNEPDFLGDDGEFNYLKAMVSAFDGIITAEKQRKVEPWTNGKLPKLTMTWSFATSSLGVDVCDERHFIEDKTAECGPGTIFMIQFYRVLSDPVNTVNYNPRNSDLMDHYQKRFINSVNLFNEPAYIETALLEPYRKLSMFKDIHLFFGEWHNNPNLPFTETALRDALTKLTGPPSEPPLVGASYFQYQIAYNKNGTERNFGMFALGEEVIGRTGYILGDVAASHLVNCLKPVPFPGSETSAAQVVSEVWQGTGASSSCSSANHNVPKLHIKDTIV